ncbi:MAG: hypothetical protein ACRDS0_37020 [Pseudonocardiaceae bacterium]
MPDAPAINPVTELLEPVRPVFRRAFELAAVGEQLVWDIAWGVTPTPQGPSAQIMVYLHCKSPLQLGALLQRVFAVPIGLTEQQLRAQVKTQVEGLLADRSKLLAPGNGHGPVKPGLIVP